MYRASHEDRFLVLEKIFVSNQCSNQMQIHELEQEILQETASALRKSEDKVNYLLLQLQVLGAYSRAAYGDCVDAIGAWNKR
jgi:hypothetical protein